MSILTIVGLSISLFVIDTDIPLSFRRSFLIDGPSLQQIYALLTWNSTIQVMNRLLIARLRCIDVQVALLVQGVKKSTVTRRDAITSHPGCAATSRGDRHGEILGFRPGTAVMIDYRVAGAPPISTKCTASLRQGEVRRKDVVFIIIIVITI